MYTRFRDLLLLLLFVCLFDLLPVVVLIIPFPVRFSLWAPYPTHKLFKLNRILTYSNSYVSAVTFPYLLIICLYYFRSWVLVLGWLCPCSSLEPMARFLCPSLLPPSGSRRFRRPKLRLGLCQFNLFSYVSFLVFLICYGIVIF